VSLVQARLLARGIDGRNRPAEKFVTGAFESVLNRPPSTEELTESQQFLVKQAELFSDPKTRKSSQATVPDEIPPSMDPQLRARENLVHVLFNHNDFVTIR
jgi:hypothetical protein